MSSCKFEISASDWERRTDSDIRQTFRGMGDDTWRCPNETIGSTDYCPAHIKENEKLEQVVSDNWICEALEKGFIKLKDGGECKVETVIGIRSTGTENKITFSQVQLNAQLDLRFADLSSIQIRESEFDSILLDGARIENNIRITDSEVNGNILASGSVIGSISITSTSVDDSIKIEDAIIDGDVNFNRANIDKNITIANTGVIGGIKLNNSVGSSLCQNFSIRRSTILGTVQSTTAIDTAGRGTANVRNNLNISNCQLNGGLVLRGVDVRNNLNITSTSIFGDCRITDGSVGNNLKVTKTDIRGSFDGSKMTVRSDLTIGNQEKEDLIVGHGINMPDITVAGTGVISPSFQDSRFAVVNLTNATFQSKCKFDYSGTPTPCYDLESAAVGNLELLSGDVNPIACTYFAKTKLDEFNFHIHHEQFDAVDWDLFELSKDKTQALAIGRYWDDIPKIRNVVRTLAAFDGASTMVTNEKSYGPSALGEAVFGDRETANNVLNGDESRKPYATNHVPIPTRWVGDLARAYLNKNRTGGLGGGKVVTVDIDLPQKAHMQLKRVAELLAEGPELRYLFQPSRRSPDDSYPVYETEIFHHLFEIGSFHGLYGVDGWQHELFEILWELLTTDPELRVRFANWDQDESETLYELKLDEPLQRAFRQSGCVYEWEDVREKLSTKRFIRVVSFVATEIEESPFLAEQPLRYGQRIHDFAEEHSPWVKPPLEAEMDTLIFTMATTTISPSNFCPGPEVREATYVNARIGAGRSGDNSATSEFFYREMKNKGIRSWEKMHQKNNYWEKLSHGQRWMSNRLLKSTAGYGERPENVLLSSLFLIGAATIYFKLSLNFMPYPDLGELGYFALSLESFTTLVHSGGTELDGVDRLFASTIGFFGAFLIALFVFTLTRSLKR